MTTSISGPMFRVVVTTSLLYSVVPTERGPLHPDKAHAMKNAAWLLALGQQALVQESPSGRCFDPRTGALVGTSRMPPARTGVVSGGFNVG